MDNIKKELEGILNPIVEKTKANEELLAKIKEDIEKNVKDLNEQKEVLKALNEAYEVLEAKTSLKGRDLYKTAKWFRDIRKKAMNTGTNSEGGYLVPQDVAKEVFGWINNISLIRRYGTVIPVNSDAIVPTFGAVTVRWIAENAQYTNDDKPTVGGIGGAPKKLMGYILTSNELLEDANIDLLNYLFQLIITGLAKEEDRVCLVGNGSGSDPFDGIGYDDNVVVSSLASTKTAYSDATIDDIIALPGLVNSDALQNAVYVMHPSLFYSIVVPGAKTSGIINLTDSQKKILGYNVVFSSSMPSYSTSENAGKPFVIFGDMSKFALIDRMNYKMTVSKDVRFDYDQTALKVVERIIGGVALGDAFAVLKTAAS